MCTGERVPVCSWLACMTVFVEVCFSVCARRVCIHTRWNFVGNVPGSVRLCVRVRVWSAHAPVAPRCEAEDAGAAPSSLDVIASASRVWQETQN